jgi:hypothetical protein
MDSFSTPDFWWSPFRREEDVPPSFIKLSVCPQIGITSLFPREGRWPPL